MDLELLEAWLGIVTYGLMVLGIVAAILFFVYAALALRAQWLLDKRKLSENAQDKSRE